MTEWIRTYFNEITKVEDMVLPENNEIQILPGDIVYTAPLDRITNVKLEIWDGKTPEEQFKIYKEKMLNPGETAFLTKGKFKTTVGEVLSGSEIEVNILVIRKNKN